MDNLGSGLDDTMNMRKTSFHYVFNTRITPLLHQQAISSLTSEKTSLKDILLSDFDELDFDEFEEVDWFSDFGEFVEPDPNEVSIYEYPYHLLVGNESTSILHPIDTPYDDFEGAAFILAIKEEKSSIVKTICAATKNESSMNSIVDAALMFFKTNCDFTEFEAQWIKNSNSYKNKTYVVTAINGRNNKREVIYLSTDLPHDTDRDVHKKFTAYDIGPAITGMIITGSLNFSEEVVEARGLTQENSARILLTHLVSTKTTPSNTESPFSFNELEPDDLALNLIDIKVERFIYKIYGNDPVFMQMHNTKVSDFDYSSFAHKSRYKTLKAIKKDLAPLSKPEFEKVWLLGPHNVNHRYFRHLKKSHMEVTGLNNSLIFRDDYLQAFFNLSNRGFDLGIREVKGVEGAYQISLYRNSTNGSLINFAPPFTVEISVNANGLILRRDGLIVSANITDLILTGWTKDTCREIWNSDHHYYEKMTGGLPQIISHWLWLMLVDQFFTQEKKKPRYLKNNGVFRSNLIKKAAIYGESTVDKDVESFNYYAGGSSQSNLPTRSMHPVYIYQSPLNVNYIEVKGISFNVGTPLFEVLYIGEPYDTSYWSLFLSGEESGFFNKNEPVSYTLMKTDINGDIKAVYCFDVFTNAIKKLISVLLRSYIAKNNGMDQYDVTRTLVATARAFGCNIELGFGFGSIQSSWSLDD